MLQPIEITQPTLKIEEHTPTHGRFVIEPLEAGYGHTLGNSLRRVLLSSLPGAAVTSIRIDGVHHEFQDIPHVKEDVTEIVLNVKHLRLRCNTQGPVEMHLDVTGERDVTAADINAPSTIEIINTDLHIATLDTPDARLSMTLVVEQGKGYRPVDLKEDQPIGQIPIDAIFTPIYKVNYVVSNTRVGQMTDYDSIAMEIWSDGTLKPEEALRNASTILVSQLRVLGVGDGPVIASGEQPSHSNGPTLSEVPIPTHIYDTPIESLGLSQRAFNCLRRSNIQRVGQVLTMTKDDLLAVRNFGEKSLDELRDKLLEHHLLPDPQRVNGASGNGQHSED